VIDYPALPFIKYHVIIVNYIGLLANINQRQYMVWFPVLNVNVYNCRGCCTYNVKLHLNRNAKNTL